MFYRGPQPDLPLGDPDIIAIARWAVAHHGAEALALMQARADEHRQAGEPEGEACWQQVANAVRVKLSQGFY